MAYAVNCDISTFKPRDIPVVEATNLLWNTVAPVTGHEHVSLAGLRNRVLAEPIMAKMALPPHHSAAMDGYAVRRKVWRRVQSRDSAWSVKPQPGIPISET